jgi:hypothetical protein
MSGASPVTVEDASNVGVVHRLGQKLLHLVTWPGYNAQVAANGYWA